MAEADRSERKSGDPDTLRLFFALWPDDATQDVLNRTGKWLHQHWGGRRMRADTLHLTLAFLGNTSLDRLDALYACADAVHAAPFALTLDRPGYWQHNRIGWLGASEVPPALIGLVSALKVSLAAAGFPVDPRPYMPHVTLLRNTAGGEVPSTVPVCWSVGAIVLVRSRSEADGAHYDVMRRWVLG